MEHFSNREQQIIEIIGRKKMTLEQISSELYKNGAHQTFDSAISTANSVRRIIKKCEFHKLAWTLEKTRVDKKLTIKRKGKTHA